MSTKARTRSACFMAVVSLVSACTWPAFGSANEQGGCDTSGRERVVEFDTSEGSMMNVDVSPDGRKIAFDVLGDIYVLPIEGGAAQRITNGYDWNTRPVWSPDGTRIAFISDQSGREQVHVVGLAGDRIPRQLSHGDDLMLSASEQMNGRNSDLAIDSVEWVPDSSAVISNGFLFSVDSGKRSALPWQSQPENSFISMTRSAVYSLSETAAMEPGGGNSDKDREYVLRQIHAKDNMPVFRMHGVKVGELPVISDDGRWVLFRDRAITPSDTSAPSGKQVMDSLRAYDLFSQSARPLLDSSLSRGWRSNVDSGFAQKGRYSITPDSKFVVVAYGGKIHKVSIETGSDTVIPFSAHIEKHMDPIACHALRMDDGAIDIKSLRTPTMSQDGTHLAFSALRKIYLMDLPQGRPRPLADQQAGQFEPAFSPDGKWIAYVSWDDSEGGALWRAPVKGGTPERLTSTPGFYQSPTWSPDGKTIAFVGSNDVWQVRNGFEVYVYGGDVRILTLANRAIRVLPAVARLGMPLGFSADGHQIRYMPFLSESEYWEHPHISSIGVDGSSPRSDEWSREDFPEGWGVAAVLPSPDGKSVAVVKRGNLYLLTCPSRGNGLAVSAAARCTEIRITHSGGRDPRWREGGKVLEWGFANTYYQARIEDLLDPEALRVDSGSDSAHRKSPRSLQSIQIDLSAPRHHAEGVVALSGARIITMRGNEVIENGVVVVRDGRILAIGPVGGVAIPEAATVIDVGGKTIMPGLIDAHAHLTDYPRDLLAKEHWEPLSYLAFGVTTVRDPSVGGDHAFAYSELVEAGVMTGPRIFAAYGLLSNGADIDSLDDARNVADRYKKLGATFLKLHEGWSRQQRRWVYEAAREAGLNVASHYSLTNSIPGRMNLSTIVDGTTSAEHLVSYDSDLYADVTNFIAKSGAAYVVGGFYGSFGHASTYYQSVKNDKRLRNLFPDRMPGLDKYAGEQDDASTVPGLIPPADSVAKIAAEILRKDGRIALGSHGDHDGFGMHWEIWAHANGGFTNHEALRAATLHGAAVIGVGADLGSIEVGKIADLVVLDKNPLENIGNTLSITHVMKSGQIYESETLDTIWPAQSSLSPWRH